ncbi:MAG: hypothetical protein P1P86_15910 [Bacteroidales bacterium]|nr:hypothetical protein [Bacteroidales bacterium]
MNRAIARFMLLLLVLAGCETEKDPAEEPLDPSLLLTDGFCLLSKNRVVLNHYDIDYYDYSAHLIYLKEPLDFEKEFTVPGTASVYADSTRIYDLSLFSAVASYIVYGPLILVPQIFYPDFVIALDKMWTSQELTEGAADEREDPRIAEALEKYGQFRQRLVCEIRSLTYTSPEDVEVRLELSNPDEESYYYLDPGKMGMGLFHYFTNGLTVWDPASSRYIDSETEPVQPDPWNSFDMEWMSLLEGGSSVSLTIDYGQYGELQPGSYDAFFTFPGLHHQVDRGDLDQQDGRIWLGDIEMSGALVVE